MGTTCSVRDFGAAGDGKALDTSAIQAALDHCAQAGGGRVVAPPGTYLIGTVYMGSRTELHLPAGAVLLASPRPADYTTSRNAAYDVTEPWRTTVAAHMICAVGTEDVAITGQGAIDGNGMAFLGAIKENHPLRRREIKGWRVGRLVAFCDCRRVRFEGVQVRNAPAIALWLHRCEHARVRGATLTSPPETPNGDGLNVESCRDVLITHCTFDTADDCIAVYSAAGPGAPGTFPMENLCISHCTLNSCVTGVRLGYHGNHPIRNVVLSELQIRARSGMTIQSLPTQTLHKESILYTPEGTPVEDVSVSDVRMETTSAPFFFYVGEEAAGGAGIRDVRLERIEVASPCASVFMGSRAKPIERLVASNLTFTVRGQMPGDSHAETAPDPFHAMGGSACLRIPHAIYARRLRASAFRDITVRWQNATGPWRQAFRGEECDGLILNRFHACGATSNLPHPAVLLTNVRSSPVGDMV